MLLPADVSESIASLDSIQSLVDGRVPDRIVGEMAVHVQLVLDELFLTTQPLELIGDPEQPPLDPAHGRAGYRYWPALTRSTWRPSSALSPSSVRT